MKNSTDEQAHYPFQWMDETVEFTLNPAQHGMNHIADDQLILIKARFPKECREVSGRLKQDVFQVHEPDRLRIIVEHYVSATDHLLELLGKYQSDHQTGSEASQYLEELMRPLTELRQFITERYGRYLDPEHPAVKLPPVKRAVYKILCSLSVDQLGLLLKAADDVKVIVGRSMSLIYKTIVPFLSTPNKKEISWDSMRSSTYHPEEADKNAVIEVLEKMIQKLRGY